MEIDYKRTWGEVWQGWYARIEVDKYQTGLKFIDGIWSGVPLE